MLYSNMGSCNGYDLAVWLSACDPLGLRWFMYKTNFIILIPTLKWTHLTLCWSMEQRGGRQSSKGPLVPACSLQLTVTPLRKELLGRHSYGMIYLNKFDVLVFFFLSSVLPTGPKGHYSLWLLQCLEFNIDRGAQINCFWFHFTRQILPMQLPSIWRHRTPEPSNRTKRLVLPSGVKSIQSSWPVWFDPIRFWLVGHNWQTSGYGQLWFPYYTSQEPYNDKI